MGFKRVFAATGGAPLDRPLPTTSLPADDPGHGLIVPASLEALNALNSQNVDYIKYINSAGLHALNTLIQPAGIH